MSLYGMHSRFIRLMKSKGFPTMGILTSLIGFRILLMGSTMIPLTAFSISEISATATLSRIIFRMSGAEHSCSSLGRLSIHAGRSSMKTWHTHATGLRQSAARRMAVTMSSPSARTAVKTDSAALLGHGMSHIAHAAGEGIPPECALRA